MTTQAAAKELIARLVAFDTTSHLSNVPIMDFIRDYLARHGVESTLLPDETGEKVNLFATIGPLDRPGVALSGHTDCVPVIGQPWDTPPFTCTQKDGLLYGRGTCDMKGFVAICLAMVPRFIEAPLLTPIHLVFSYDEEIGCTGVRPMIEKLGTDLPLPKAVIVGEPTGMEVVDAHKGISDFSTEIIGHESHSSMDLVAGNALVAGARFIGELMRLREQYVSRGDASGRFVPPYTSIHAGQINAGTATNIVPRRCEIGWEVRSLPEHKSTDVADAMADFCARELLPVLQAASPDTYIETVMKVDAPGLAPDPGSLAETLAKRLSGHNDTHTVSYATEAGLFQLAGSPTVVCGPGGIAQAHRPNEYISLAQVDTCLQFMEKLAQTCRAGL
ncbi:acetylornithine deacetylase [Tepidamorphus sp. 3E244]|uniref:acetylornithine deacetylase n=1 Tax=Tepidamorphus sp. 3E244 TaxID=3385498 RepID=UPI0038FC144F